MSTEQLPQGDLTQEQRRAIHRQHRYDQARSRACRVLGYYLSAGTMALNKTWGPVNKAEVEGIVDDIIEAVRNCDNQ